MCLILRNNINYFRYLACLLINWYGLGKLVDVKVVSFYKTSVDKDASSFKVNQSLHKERLGGVMSGSLKVDLIFIPPFHFYFIFLHFQSIFYF